MHFYLRSLDPVYFILVHSRALFTHTHSDLFEHFFWSLMYFFTISSREFWVTAFHLLNRERNLSELFSSLLLLLSPSPFFSQVIFGWLYVYGMRQCSSIWALKYISKRSTHFIMNCWQSSNRCSWHRKFVSWTMAWRWRQCFLWMCERAKKMLCI